MSGGWEDGNGGKVRPNRPTERYVRIRRGKQLKNAAQILTALFWQQRVFLLFTAFEAPPFGYLKLDQWKEENTVEK